MEEYELLKDDYEKMLALQKRIKEKVAQAIRDGKFIDGKKKVFIGDTLVINVKRKKGSADNYEFEAQKKSISGKATKDSTGKIDVDIDLDSQTVHLIIDKKIREQLDARKRIEEHQVDDKTGDILKQEIEQGLTNGNAVRMETRRENTRTETFGMFVRRAFGEKDVHEVYRVKGKDPHDFKYVIEKSDGTYKKIDISTRSEGRNNFQKVWIMKDGKLQEKAVDSLLLKGQYGIATDIPENVASNNTTTYMVQRLPNGQYIGIEVAQASGVNRNTSGNIAQKDLMSKTKSKYQLEDTVEAANLAQGIEPIMQDGILTTEELMLVKKLKEEKNMSNREVKATVDTIVCLRELGFKCNEIEQMLSKWDKKEFEQISEEIKRGNITKDDIEEDQKLPGGGIRSMGYDPKHE